MMGTPKENTPKQNSRSLILEIEDAKVNISREINSALRKGVPCYFVRDILERFLAQVKEGANTELKKAREQETAQAKSETGEES